MMMLHKGVLSCFQSLKCLTVDLVFWLSLSNESMFYETKDHNLRIVLLSGNSWFNFTYNSRVVFHHVYHFTSTYTEFQQPFYCWVTQFCEFFFTVFSSPFYPEEPSIFHKLLSSMFISTLRLFMSMFNRVDSSTDQCWNLQMTSPLQKWLFTLTLLSPYFNQMFSYASNFFSSMAD